MLINGLNEVRLKAIEMAFDIMKDEYSKATMLKTEDRNIDLFTLADKIYTYITNIV